MPLPQSAVIFSVISKVESWLTIIKELKSLIYQSVTFSLAKQAGEIKNIPVAEIKRNSNFNFLKIFVFFSLIIILPNEVSLNKL
jgi:hypothetical protein